MKSFMSKVEMEDLKIMNRKAYALASPEPTDRAGRKNNNETAADRTDTDGYIRADEKETRHWNGMRGTTYIILVNCKLYCKYIC